LKHADVREQNGKRGRIMNAFELEEMSNNHWPALSTMLYDGWVLRFAEGYTKRANSISPLYPSTLDLERKIQVCEELYARHGLPAVYKLTPFVQPAHLDGLLEEMGYAMGGTISVQTLDLDQVPEEPRNRSVEIVESFTADWLDAYGALSGVQPEDRRVLERMLANIRTPAACASLRLDGRVAACGMGVLERGTLGVFCVVTDPGYRNRGLGGQLMLRLLQWGKANEAKRSYLQVETGNAPALRLYAKLGYRELYKYWYRVKKG
jgi:Predicted acetyltransferase